jgi:hypothetical protein
MIKMWMGEQFFSAFLIHLLFGMTRQCISRAPPLGGWLLGAHYGYLYRKYPNFSHFSYGAFAITR